VVLWIHIGDVSEERPLLLLRITALLNSGMDFCDLAKELTQRRVLPLGGDLKHEPELRFDGPAHLLAGHAEHRVALLGAEDLVYQGLPVIINELGLLLLSVEKIKIINEEIMGVLLLIGLEAGDVLGDALEDNPWADGPAIILPHHLEEVNEFQAHWCGLT